MAGPAGHRPSLPPGPVVYLNGASSAGKTTLAAALQAAVRRPSLRLEADGFFSAVAQPEPWALWPVVAAFHTAAATAAEGGMLVVVDSLLLMRTWLHDAVERLAERRSYLVAVRCPPAELERREAARQDRRPGLAVSQLDVVHAHGVYDFEVDTSAGSPDECAGRLAAWLAGEPEPSAFRTLRGSAYLNDEAAYGWVLVRGSEGAAVRRLQEDLTRVGHDPGPADGAFGERTETALRAFQAACGLPPDGAVGWPRTIKALQDALGGAGHG